MTPYQALLILGMKNRAMSVLEIDGAAIEKMGAQMLADELRAAGRRNRRLRDSEPCQHLCGDAVGFCEEPKK